MSDDNERAKRVIEGIESLGDFRKLGGQVWCLSVHGRGLLDASELRIIADELDRRNGVNERKGDE